MKSIILIAFTLIAITCAFKDDPHWKEYKKNHPRAYKDDTDEEKRFKNFKRNDDKIKAHNEKHSKGESVYTMGHNHFSEMDDDEIKAMFPIIPPTPTNRALPQGISPAQYPTGPAAVSWKHLCLPPLNQQQCSSCWAFATAAQIESLLKNKYSTFNTYLSPQYLLDCAPNKGCGITGGGDPSAAMNYIYNNGITSNIAYPYTGYQKPCNNNIQKTKLISSHSKYTLGGNEQYLKNILASIGPVVVLMHVDTNTLTSYKTGVYWNVGCPSKCETINHAVLLVGYGTDFTTYSSPVDYWLIKNSWSNTWGESGYFRIIRNRSGFYNNCNIACYTFQTTV